MKRSLLTAGALCVAIAAAFLTFTETKVEAQIQPGGASYLKKKHYVILKNTDSEALSTEVVGKLGEGYQLHGDLVVTEAPGDIIPPGKWFIQAMVR